MHFIGLCIICGVGQYFFGWNGTAKDYIIVSMVMLAMVLDALDDIRRRLD